MPWLIPVVAAVGSIASAGSAIANATKKKESGGETITAEQMIPDFQKQAGSQLSDFVGKYLPGYEPGADYKGNLTTQATGLENTGLSQLAQLLSNNATGDLFSAGKNQLMETLSGKYADPNSSPFIQSMTKLANQNLQDQLTTARGQRGARGTYFTKAAIGEEGDLRERTLNNLQGIVGQFTEGERNRMFQAAPMAQVMDEYENLNAPLQKIQASQTFGGLQRTIDMSNIEKEYQDFLRKREEQALPVAAAQSLYGTQQPYGIKSMTAPVQEENSTLGNILGLVGRLNTSSLSGGGTIWDKIGGLLKNF